MVVALECPLQKHHEEIVNLNPQPLLGQLKAHGLVTSEEESFLLNPDYSPQKRTTLLLLLLHSKNPNNYVQLFYQCLRAETQDLRHQNLADRLEPDINPSGANYLNDLMTEPELDRILIALKSCWVQVAEELSAPQEMVDEISLLQDPEEQARMFFERYSVHSGKESIRRVLDQLGIPLY